MCMDSVLGLRWLPERAVGPSIDSEERARGSDHAAPLVDPA